MGHCRDCKYWERFGKKPELGTCTVLEVIGGREDPLLVRQENPGIMNCVTTAPDFGCTEFEAKE